MVGRWVLQTAKIKERFDSLGVAYNGTQQTGGLISTSPPLGGWGAVYFYHSDHLGSSSLITDGTGALVQHIEYVPFGEVFVDERNSTWSTPYKFNGKERDEETGLYYYGARYYDSRTSVWLSVDPLAEKYMNVGSYVYCNNNPVKYIDPDGKEVKDIEILRQTNGEYVHPIQAKAYLGFAKTKIGQFFLGKFAKAGQTIAGHKYSEDGEYHKNKIDLVLVGGKDFKSQGLKSGEAEPSINNARLQITIRTSGTRGLVDMDDISNDLSVFNHEFFIHALQFVQDFSKDGKLDNSNIYKALKDHTNKHQLFQYRTNYMQHFQERNVNKYMSKYGIPVLDDYMKKNNVTTGKEALIRNTYNFKN
jgi:RHS repeat-associated protein